MKDLEYYQQKWNLQKRILTNKTYMDVEDPKEYIFHPLWVDLINTWFLPYLIPDWLDLWDTHQIRYPTVPYTIYVRHKGLRHHGRGYTPQKVMGGTLQELDKNVTEVLAYETYRRGTGRITTLFDMEKFEEDLASFPLEKYEEKFWEGYELWMDSDETHYDTLSWEQIKNPIEKKYISGVLCPDWKKIFKLKGWETNWIYDD